MVPWIVWKLGYFIVRTKRCQLSRLCAVKGALEAYAVSRGSSAKQKVMSERSLASELEAEAKLANDRHCSLQCPVKAFVACKVRKVNFVPRKSRFLSLGIKAFMTSGVVLRC